MAAEAGCGGGKVGKTKGLDCPICFESYGSSVNVPMVLSCGHTLCENCVAKHRRTGDKVRTVGGRVGAGAGGDWSELPVVHQGRFSPETAFPFLGHVPI